MEEQDAQNKAMSDALGKITTTTTVMLNPKDVEPGIMFRDQLMHHETAQELNRIKNKRGHVCDVAEYAGACIACEVDKKMGVDLDLRERLKAAALHEKSVVEHVCGLQGFGQGPDDVCPACQVPWVSVRGRNVIGSPENPVRNWATSKEDQDKFNRELSKRIDSIVHTTLNQNLLVHNLFQRDVLDKSPDPGEVLWVTWDSAGKPTVHGSDQWHLITRTKDGVFVNGEKVAACGIGVDMDAYEQHLRDMYGPILPEPSSGPPPIPPKMVERRCLDCPTHFEVKESQDPGPTWRCTVCAGKRANHEMKLHRAMRRDIERIGFGFGAWMYR